ncbi:hypothetical protein TTHERM_00346600 (macronuclear) [Tetrahymena thermophila SB210]|uniref:Kinase domain protein n=1 Tax=Tetrahymena thermophila (strain SB210) TaxID=312017 RepID=I7MF08_TETTS|nr:hypothetical protein TTHERM_00346600 [Tetrahymena thermophila SB210]EAR98262.2 hypothetical protein TTHERM_00346600 [Tetrahymena thermophila SB210]|eukprot:XP_001018507.2 hypothetical protein TTHERM_00346600 [Tetrahymena thermophila SB210]
MKQIIYVTESLHENDFKKSLNKSQHLQNTHLKIFFQKFLHSKYANIASIELLSLKQITNYQIHAEGFSDIEEQDEIKFGKSIQSLENLNHLQIAAGDQITSNFIIGVLEGLKQLHKLESFNLYLLNIKHFNNEIYSDILGCFKNIQHLKSLRFFLRRTSNWTHSMQLGEEIQYLESLQKLYLSFPQNNLNNSALYSLSSGISKLKNLESLNINLDENEISPDTVYYFGICLQPLNKLSKLYLRFNKAKIGDYGCEGLAKGIFNLKILKKVRIKIGPKNNISDIGASHLANSFKSLENITKFGFFIHGNQQVYNKTIELLADSLNKMFIGFKQIKIIFLIVLQEL